MRFARWTFVLAGVYGVLVVAPLYFLEAKISREQPPPISHVEYFYGFIGVTLAWQLLFLVIANDPVRFRPAMPVAVLEKVSFAAAVLALYALGRVGGQTLAFSMIDGVLGALFVAAYVRTPRQ